MADELTLTEVDGTLATAIAGLGLPEEILAAINEADAVLIPYKEFREDNTPVFPHGTHDFYHFILQAIDETESVEIASTDDDYREIAMYSHELVVTLATIVCGPRALKFVMNLVKLFSDFKRADKVKVKIKLSENKKGKTLEINYEGPSGEMQDKVLPAVVQMFPDYDVNSPQPVIADKKKSKRAIEG